MPTSLRCQTLCSYHLVPPDQQIYEAKLQISANSNLMVSTFGDELKFKEDNGVSSHQDESLWSLYGGAVYRGYSFPGLYRICNH